MKKSDRGISSDAVDGNKTKVDLPVGKKKPPSQMSKLGGRNGMQQHQGAGTSGVPQGSGNGGLLLPSIRCLVCNISMFKTTAEAANHFGKPHNCDFRAKDRLMAHVFLSNRGKQASIENILKLILKTLPTVEILCFDKRGLNCLVVMKPITKDTKKEYYEKYTQGQKLKTLDGGEVFFQANKTYAHIINQAQEEAANCKRPGPNWKEVEQKLESINGLGAQMKQLKHFILMDEKTEVKDREGLCDHIYQLLTNRFQDPFVSVKMFGSSINGFGFKGCDVDILVDISNRHFQVAASDLKDDDDIDRILQKKKAQATEKTLKGFPRNFKAVQSIRGARVPIVKCFAANLRLFCDLSFKNEMSLLNSQFIREVFDSEEKFHDFAIAVRYWAFRYELGGFTGRHNSTSFSNYALIMMMVFYLQSKKLLPSVEIMQEKLSKKEQRDIDGWECGYDIDQGTNRYMFAARSVVTAPELLHGFFQFYADFNYKEYVISPYTGSPVHRLEFDKISARLQCKDGRSSEAPDTAPIREDKYWQVLNQRFSNSNMSTDNKNNQKKYERKLLPVGSEVVVQDPFELNHNVSKGIGDIGLENWINHCAESAKILCDSNCSASLTVLLSLKLDMPKPKQLSKKEQRLQDKLAKKEAKEKAKQAKQKANASEDAASVEKVETNCNGLVAIQKNYTGQQQPVKVIRAKRADTTASESSSSTSTSTEASISSDDESETGTDTTDVSAKDGAGALEKAKIKAGLQAALKSLDRVEKQLGGRDVEIQVDPPLQRTSEEPLQLNTELQSALEHLDNLTKQAPVIEKSLGDLVMQKADPIQEQTSASKRQEATKDEEEKQEEVAPVLKTHDLTVQTSHGDEGISDSFAIDVKAAVVSKALNNTTNHDQMVKHVDKTVRSVLRRVLLMDVAPSVLESQNLLEQGLGLKLNESGADTSGQAGEEDWVEEYIVTSKHPVWEFRKSVRKEHSLHVVNTEVETAVTHLVLNKLLTERFESKAFIRGDPAPCTRYKMTLQPVEYNGESIRLNCLLTSATPTPDQMGKPKEQRQSTAKSGLDFLKGFLPKMVNVQIAESIKWQKVTL